MGLGPCPYHFTSVSVAALLGSHSELSFSTFEPAGSQGQSRMRSGDPRFNMIARNPHSPNSIHETPSYASRVAAHAALAQLSSCIFDTLHGPSAMDHASVSPSLQHHLPHSTSAPPIHPSGAPSTHPLLHVSLPDAYAVRRKGHLPSLGRQAQVEALVATS